MNKIELVPFDLVSAPELKVIASVDWQSDILEVVFDLKGDLSKISLPKRDEPRRIIGLWEYTCLEIFIKDMDSPHYLEFNFSPELHWNCFIFEKPRIQLVEYMELEDVEQLISQSPSHYQHKIQINTAKLPAEFGRPGRRQIGPNAVIANGQNRLSYWACEHHQDKPDFHDPKGMTIIT